MDDIQCTSIDGNTIINICIKDCNDACQLIAFAVTQSKKEEDFKHFISDIKEHHGEPRVFVVDRCGQQYDAISQLTESKIVFCKVHVRRNIEEMFGNTIVVKIFDRLMRGIINDDEYIAILNEESSKRDDISKKRLQKLLKDMVHYSPTHTSSLRLRCQYTTNTVEGFHGSLRNLLEGKHRIDEVIKVIDHQHQQLIIKSYHKFDNFEFGFYRGPPFDENQK